MKRDTQASAASKLPHWSDFPYFHTFADNGDLQYQGVVLCVLANGDLRVQLFSALDGAPTAIEVWEPRKHRMKFYASEGEWHEAHNAGVEKMMRR